MMMAWRPFGAADSILAKGGRAIRAWLAALFLAIGFVALPAAAVAQVPTVTSLSPSSGPISGGTLVTVNGTNFTGVTGVTFGGTSIGYTVLSPTQIRFTTTAGGAGLTRFVYVTNASGQSSGGSNAFTYVSAPNVTSVNPNAGSAQGGNTVTITGSNFYNATQVSFGGTYATSFSIISGTQISAVVPAGPAGNSGHVTVTNPGGTSTTSAGSLYTYAAIPTVSSISPTSGPATGGASVVITGTGFANANRVDFGGMDAASFTINSNTQITAVTPAFTASGCPCNWAVFVSSPSGRSSVSPASYTFILPQISGISPSSGSSNGGTSVVLTGLNLNGATAVSFGGTPATSFAVNSPTQVTAIAPTGTGTVDIRITTPNGTTPTSSATKFTYIASPPVVSAISPASGSTAGGQSVAITGAGFMDATEVNFGATPATSFTVGSANQITAIAPAGSGVVDVTVANSTGTSTTSAATKFSYTGMPTVTAVSPSTGPRNGGNSVVITGTNLTAATQVKFGSDLAPSFTVNSPTQITAIAPSGTGSGLTSNHTYITVTTPGGTSTATSASAYHFVGAPSIASISPASGPAAGGNTVTITGDFLTANSVKFGGVEATSFTLSGWNQITAVAPAGSGAIDVAVTNDYGTSTPSTRSAYTYLAPPAVTAISPASGVSGTNVTITGTGFAGVTGVSFGATPAASFTVNSATQIAATAPAGSGAVDIRVTNGNGTSATSSSDQFSYVAAPVASSFGAGTVPFNAGAAPATQIALSGYATNSPTTYAVGSGTSANGGSVNVNSSGLASYTPAVGFSGSDSFTFTASNAGGTSAPATVSLIVDAPTVTIAPATMPAGSVGAAYSQSLSASGGVAPYSFAVTAGSLPAGLSLSSAGLISGTPVAAGAFNATITATDSSGAPGRYSGTLATSIGIGAGSQTISFANPGPQTFGASATLTASASSGLPVSFASTTTGVCTVSGSTLSLVGTGTCTIDATQAGDANYAAAPSVSRSFSVAAAGQTISFANPGPQTFGASATLTASASSGLPVSFASTTTGVCTVSGSTLSLVGTGTCTIDATQAGDANYAAAPSVSRSFSVAAAGQTISFANPGPQTFGTSATLTASASSGLPVSFASTTTGVCTVSGSTLSLVGTGTCTIDATQAGDANYAAAPSVSRSFSVAAAGQTISFANPGPQTFGASATLTASASSGLPVSFASTTTGVCTVSGSTLSLVGTGTCTIDATQAGDANYAAAPSVSRSFSVAAAGQTISFANPGPQTFGASATLTASASSGLPVSFASTTTGVCTVSGSTLSLVGTGTCTIDATQAGDANYAAAPSVSRSFSVAAAGQTISFANPGPQTFGASATLTASASSGLPVSFASTTTGVCTVSGSTLSLVGTGTCTIDATQAGDANYAAAPSVSRSFSVAAAGQTISFANPGPQTFGTSATLTASASSGLPVSFASTTTGVCTVSGSTLSLVGTGTCTIDATQAGDANYAAAPSVSRSFSVAAAGQTISFANPGPQTFGASATLTASASSGLPVSFASTTTGVCTVSGSTLSLVGTGTCTIDATQAGDANYAAAPSVSRSFSVAAAGQTISFANPGPQTFGTSPTITATASSGLTIGFSSSTTGVCTITSGGTLTFVGIGTCTINADQAGDSNYSAASTVTQSFTVSTPPLGTSSRNVTGTVAQPLGPVMPVTASGGQPGYAYALTGTLPAGLTFSTATGAISGTPTASLATTTYTVTVTDSLGQTTSGTFQLTIGAPTITVAPSTLPNATSGVAYSQAISASGGTAPYTYSVSAGALPAGITLSSTGTLAGTATTAGTYNFTVTATDSSTGAGPFTGSRAYSLRVDLPPPPVIAPVPSQSTPGNTSSNSQSLTIDLAPYISGQYTSVAIVTPTSHGSLTLAGTTATYTPVVGYSGGDSFSFTATGPGGTSAPATVTIDVEGVEPSAANLTATATQSVPVTVDLTAGAAGGPFTGATVVSVSPSGSLTTSIAGDGQGHYILTATPSPTFDGVAVVTYTLSNDFGASAPATVTITVAARPNPAADATVNGVSAAQAEAVRRFAVTQLGNFQRRNEQLHHGGGAGVSTMVSLGSGDDEKLRRAQLAFNVPGWAAPEARNAAPTASDTAQDTGVVSLAPPAPAFAARPVGSLALWSGGALTVGSRDDVGDRDGLDFNSQGLSAGLDYRFTEGLTLGIGGGVGWDRTDVGQDDAGRVRSKAWSVAAYGSLMAAPNVFVDGVIGVGDVDNRTRRAAANGETAFGDRDGRITFASLGAGYDGRSGNTDLSVYGKLDWLRANLDAYVEQGAGISDLAFASRRVTSLAGVLGTRASWQLDGWRPHVRAEWRHEFKGLADQRVDYSDVGTYRFTLGGEDWSTNSFSADVGADVSMGAGWTGGIEVGGGLGNNSRFGTARASIAKQF